MTAFASPIGILEITAYAAFFSLVTTPLVRKFALSIGCVSHPTRDRWGRRVIPRLGGLPIGLAFLAATGWGITQDHRMVGLFFAALLMFITGLIDDLKRLHPYTKLIAQIIASCWVVLQEIHVSTAIPWLTIPITILWLVLVMNAFNLMDNMDGLSAGVGVIAASFCIWHALQTQQWVVAFLLAGLCGATLGFLRYNFPPAKIFMGDTGSQVLGLGLGSLALLGTWHQSTRLAGIAAFPTLLLTVPIFDTCFVTVQRLLHGRHPFQGGTDHLSHRLGILGLSTRQVVLTLYLVSATFGVLSLFLPIQNPMMVAGVSLLAIGLLLVVGGYFAKVRVYTGVSDSTDGRQVTLIETMLMYKRRLMEVGVDFSLICASYVIAHALRFEATLGPFLQGLILRSLPWIIAVKMTCFFLCGLYRGVWRYISLSDLVNILRAVVASSILSALVVLYLWRFEGYSRAVFVIDGLLLFVAISGARLIEPLLNEWITASIQGAVPVLIVGAGDTGELLLQQLKLEKRGTRRVIGFLDDDRAKQGDRIHGIPIMGTRHELGRMVQEFRVREVFIAIPHPPADLVQMIRSYCEENGLAWKMVGTAPFAESRAP